MFDAQDARFRSIKLRPKQAGCVVCGENPSVTQLVDYESFCGSAATDKVGLKLMFYLILWGHTYLRTLLFEVKSISSINWTLPFNLALKLHVIMP